MSSLILNEEQKLLDRLMKQGEWEEKQSDGKVWSFIARTDDSYTHTGELAGTGWTLVNEGELLNAGAFCTRAEDSFEVGLKAVYAVLKTLGHENLSNFLFGFHYCYQSPKQCYQQDRKAEQHHMRLQ